ncbi:hypothetical protein EPO15_04265 [bacterium]|nr:MAG: hypothetical protein EPO15_04265 [bacterium]
MKKDGDGELVERGTFRFDPAAAAEKLAEYQLPDARDFLVPWLRAAGASGAKRVSAGVVDGALTFSFDGDAPSPAALSDLVSGLLGAEGGEAERHLAYGALALRRLEPGSVAAAREDGRTVIRVRWAGGGPAAAALKRLRAAYGMSETELTIDGEPVPDPAKAPEPVKAWRGTRTRVALFEDVLSPGDGRMRVYVRGALAEEVPVSLGGRYTAYVANDRFALSLSQSAVIKDARFGKVVRRLERLRRRLSHLPPSPATRARSAATVAAAAAAAAALAGLGYWAAARVLLP